VLKVLGHVRKQQGNSDKRVGNFICSNLSRRTRNPGYKSTRLIFFIVIIFVPSGPHLESLGIGQRKKKPGYAAATTAMLD